MAEISETDAKIRDVVESITFDGMKCNWILAMRTRDDFVFHKILDSYPIIIQYVEEKETDNKFGGVIKTIDFYIAIPRRNANTFTTKYLHDNLSKIVLLFQNKLSLVYKCNFVGQRERLIDQIVTIKEAGIFFTLEINIGRQC